MKMAKKNASVIEVDEVVGRPRFRLGVLRPPQDEGREVERELLSRPVERSRVVDRRAAGIHELERGRVNVVGVVQAPAVHAPWEAPPLALAEAGVILGDTYPAPIVDHALARERTLDAYKRALASAPAAPGQGTGRASGTAVGGQRT